MTMEGHTGEIFYKMKILRAVEENGFLGEKISLIIPVLGGRIAMEAEI